MSKPWDYQKGDLVLGGDKASLEIVLVFFPRPFTDIMLSAADACDFTYRSNSTNRKLSGFCD